jgi:hypothetical protein
VLTAVPEIRLWWWRRNVRCVEVNPLKHVDYYIYHLHSETARLSQQSVRMLHTIPTANNAYLPNRINQLTFVMETRCVFPRAMNWGFKYLDDLTASGGQITVSFIGFEGLTAVILKSVCFNSGVGWDWVRLVNPPPLGLVFHHHVVIVDVCGAVGGINYQGKPEYSEKICPSATLSTTNSTGSDLRSNPDRHGNLLTNRQSYGSFVWDVTPHRRAEIRRRFGRTCLHL